jgi:hypothetical protein
MGCPILPAHSLMNNIILLKKEDMFNHMGESINTGHLSCELLDMTMHYAQR